MAMLINCRHDFISILKPFYTGDKWNLKKWAAECSDCGTQGVLVEGEGFFPDPVSEIERALFK